MTGALLLIAGLATAEATALNRVAIIAEDPGTWLNYDAPMARVRPATTAIRFITQVQPVWNTPWTGWTVGTSLQSQTIRYDHLVWAAGSAGQFSVGGGVQTALLLPRGALATASWHRSAWRVDAGLSAISGATWARPDWTMWHPMPTVGVSWTREKTGKGAPNRPPRGPR